MITTRGALVVGLAILIGVTGCGQNARSPSPATSGIPMASKKPRLT